MSTLVGGFAGAAHPPAGGHLGSGTLRTPTPAEADDPPQVTQPKTPSECLSSSAPNFLMNCNDLSHLLRSLVKPNVPLSINSTMNMIPEFDPSIKNHRIDLWIAKVNECAKIYRWDESQIMHYALPKLVGNAKKWYHSQTSILHTWDEWKILLCKAFPTETNYGVLLSEMLDKRLKFGENLDEYYYDKVMLLGACGISGKRAVDCIIHGIDDRMTRSGASSARFTEPEDLYKFLKDVCKEQKDISRTSDKNRQSNSFTCNRCNESGHSAAQCHAVNLQANQDSSSLVCFNCKEKGHKLQQCPKAIIKCEECKRFGHNSSNCFFKKDQTEK
ncbi:hypothetical protein ABMA27_004873 [Loxostege sticticalis]|uniref:CCHC-type domain-containing protein n=1 Tax=Loxostege sticticalis TaxID=481309 RepID=A0ABR3HKY6_LOXSC